MFTIPITIDTSDIINQFNVSQSQIDAMCDNIAKSLAMEFASELEEQARENLRRTRRRYIKNIRLVDSGRLQGTVMLDYSKDKLIPMLEEGATAFDIKRGLLSSKKAKKTSDGRKYITVPFRWATPNAIADGEQFTGKLPSSVYKAIKSKAPSIPTIGGLRSKGLMRDELPTVHQTEKTRPKIVTDSTIYEAYRHVSSLYEGVFKKQDAATRQSSYHSFRRVSESGINADGEKIGSDPMSWIHPGIDAYNLVQRTYTDFRPELHIGPMIDNELRKLGFDV